jgi:hypothetical protein
LAVCSTTIGPRHPLKKDLTLNYEVDSDEEWEEVRVLSQAPPMLCYETESKNCWKHLIPLEWLCLMAVDASESKSIL